MLRKLVFSINKSVYVVVVYVNVCSVSSESMKRMKTLVCVCVVQESEFLKFENGESAGVRACRTQVVF